MFKGIAKVQAKTNYLLDVADSYSWSEQNKCGWIPEIAKGKLL